MAVLEGPIYGAAVQASLFLKLATFMIIQTLVCPNCPITTIMIQELLSNYYYYDSGTSSEML
jgi:hypothetical protein